MKGQQNRNGPGFLDDCLSQNHYSLVLGRYLPLRPSVAWPQTAERGGRPAATCQCSAGGWLAEGIIWARLRVDNVQELLKGEERASLVSRPSSQHSPPFSRLCGPNPEGLGRQTVARARFPCLGGHQQFPVPSSQLRAHARSRSKGSGQQPSNTV